jgi:hypothetical protein
MWWDCWCSERGATGSATGSFLLRLRLPTLARAFAETVQKAKIVCLAVLTRLARLATTELDERLRRLEQQQGART